MAIILLQNIAILFFTAAIHELGHAAAHMVYRIQVWEIMIFSGSPKHSLRFRIKNFVLAIGWLPYGGYVLSFAMLTMRQDFIITACGPAANLLAAAGLFFSPTGAWLTFCQFNLFMFFYALLPVFPYKDGYRLLKLFKQWYHTPKQSK